MTRLLAIRGALLGGLLGFSFAVGFASLAPAQAPKKDQPKKEEPKKEQPLEQLFPQLPRSALPADADPELKQLEEELRLMQDQILRQLGQMQGLQPGAFRNMPGIQVNPAIGNLQAVPKENRLGAVLKEPSPALVDQLDLPKDQGVVIEKLNDGSAGGKGGLKANDILLELDGKTVPSKVDDFVMMLNDIKPDKPVNATVLRKGRRETVKGIKLPQAKFEEQPRQLFPNQIPNIQIRPLIPKLPPPLPPGGVGDAASIQMIRSGDAFTTRLRNGNESVAVEGKMKDGKAVVDQIVLSDGKDTKKYKSLNQVPEDMRDQIKNLILMTEKNTATVIDLDR